MRKLNISIFTRAADANATRQSLTFEELIEDFREPEICELPATLEAADALKLEAPAWSSSLYQNDHRSKANFTSASLLVFDLDEVQDLVGLLKNLELLGVCYAVHSTTRSGFKPHKLRVLFPLARDYNAIEYDALWLELSRKLGVEPDPTRRHPSGIYFAPVIFREHLSSYIFECRTDGPLLGQTFNKKLEPKHNESYWLGILRAARQKHDALNKCAFAMAKLGCTDVVEKCLGALRENKVSEPVQDWTAARFTAVKAVEEAGEPDVDAVGPGPDPLEKQAEPDTAPPALRKTAEARLRKCLRELAQGGSLQTAAFELGKFVPHALSAEKVTDELLKVWDKSKSKTSNKQEADNTIAAGIAAGSARPAGVWDAWKDVLFKNTEGTGFAATESNTQLVITNHPELDDLLAQDVRQNAAVYLRPPPWMAQPPAEFPARVGDETKRELGPWIAREIGVNNVSANVAFESLLSRAAAVDYDVLVNYYTRLPQATGTDILDQVLIRCAGAPDCEYTRLATRYWFTSVYARQIRPGCKVDHALILVGEQGLGKSTFFKTIFPSDISRLCSTDVIPDWEDKDCKISLSRFAVVELAELDQMNKSTIESIKKFLTEERADVRPAYGRTSREYPRRTVFGGSTNKRTGFLVDPTGNRRFWPLHVEEFNMSWLHEHRDLIWAQAKWAYETTHKWHPEGPEVQLFREAQDAAVMLESFHEDIVAVLDVPCSSVHWKPKGRSGDGLALLIDGQKMGEIPNVCTTKQLAEILELEHDNIGILARIRRSLEILGWREGKVGKNRIWTRKQSPSGS